MNRASRQADDGGPDDASAIEHAALVRLLIAKGVISYDELLQTTNAAAKLFRDVMADGRKKITWETDDAQLVELAKESQARISAWLRTGA